MLRVLIVSVNKVSLSVMESVFEENGARVEWAESSDTAFVKIKKEKFDLIITDENLTDITGLECIEKLISSDPFLNTAAISSLSTSDFHKESEGLGVLMQLSIDPGKKDVVKLHKQLKGILTLTKKAN